MMKIKTTILCLTYLALSHTSASQTFAADNELVEDPAKQCFNCDDWNKPQHPYQVFGNTYFVGTSGLASILIVSTEGLILIDGALSQSAGLIARNITTLGFDPADIKILLNSHAHFDHAGGLAALQRFSGADVFASKDSADVLSAGLITAADPQFGFGEDANRFPAISKVKLIAENNNVSLGDVQLTAHYTPGHTPGSTTWTWQSCEEENCLNMVYADSLSAVSANGYSFSDPELIPSAADQIVKSTELVRSLACDILMSPHPFLFQMEEKLQTLESQPDANPFYDPLACEAYADFFMQWLERRLAEESE